MSYGEVLFQGTWRDAVGHPDQIPEAMRVQIVEAERTGQGVPREEFRTIVDELILEAREANASGEEDDPETTSDAYTLILQETNLFARRFQKKRGRLLRRTAPRSAGTPKCRGYPMRGLRLPTSLRPEAVESVAGGRPGTAAA